MKIEELFELEKKYRKLKKTCDILVPILVVSIAVIIATSIFLYVRTKRPIILTLFLLILLPIIVYVILDNNKKRTYNLQYAKLERGSLKSMGLSNWMYLAKHDTRVYVKSRRAVYDYTDIKYFKESRGKLDVAITTADRKQQYKVKLMVFLKQNDFKSFSTYPLIERKIRANLETTSGYSIDVVYISPKGRNYVNRTILVSQGRLLKLQSDKTLLMSKGEYNKYLKDKEKELLETKQHKYYGKVNRIIDFANENKDILVIKGDIDELDKQIDTLFDRTINSIKKIKRLTSEEWDLVDKFIIGTDEAVKEIIKHNKMILDYYGSLAFKKIKDACSALMNSQREFNEYIDEKVKSISDLFGTKIVRNETNIEDEYNYIHEYKKSVNPFVAEVSANVFASAENSPLDYVVKNFYPNKERYPEQIQKLQLLIAELETLKEAKQIIEHYKQEVQQHLANVPAFVMENDEEGFYSRLGFAIINESVLTVEYKFCYTSGGGHAQRSFTVPMTEKTIVDLINALESKLTMTAFSREQRSMMTSKLRQHIKERDNFTCKCCGNSTHKEPNLLLEIDHIIPVAKGGTTEENNLQTLCWKCNRQKSSKIID